MAGQEYTVKGGFNKIAPIRYGQVLADTQDVAGHVIPEVLIQKVVNRMFGKKSLGFIEAALVHTFSIPFVGGLGAPIAPEKHPGLDGAWSDQFQAGFAGFPAVLVGQYIVEVLYGSPLFHWNFGIRDAIVSAVSKTITRPVLSSLNSLMPAMLSSNYDRLQARFDMQAENSNLRMSKKSV